MGEIKRLSVGISLDQWGNADPAIFDDEYGNYVEWATVDQLLRDVRVLQAEVNLMRDKKIEYAVHCGHFSELDKATCDSWGCRIDAARKAVDNSGALTRWGER